MEDFYLLLTYKCNVTPRSRNSFTDNNGEIISCPQLSYTKICKERVGRIQFVSDTVRFYLTSVTSVLYS